MILLLWGFLFAQDKVLLEQGKVKTLPAILSEELQLEIPAVTVVIPNTTEIPEYFFTSQVGKSFTDVLKEREKMMCSTVEASFLSCYSCQQENDQFLFTFEFGKKPTAKECELVRYSVKIKNEKNQEKTVIAYLQKMGFAVDEKTFSTPMVFEKSPLQINIKTAGNLLVIDILEPEMQSLRASFDSKFGFLQEEVRNLWPQYVYVTEQYLKEVGVNKKDILNTKKSATVTNNADFIKKISELQETIAKSSSKEEKACYVYQDKDLLNYPVSEEVNKELKLNIKKHWSEAFSKELQDTVCGNFYYLEKVKAHFNNNANCEAFEVAEEKKLLNQFLTKNISILEKQLATIFSTTLEIKTIYKNPSINDDKKKEDIAKELSRLADLGDGYQSYATFKKTQWLIFKPELETFRCVL